MNFTSLFNLPNFLTLINLLSGCLAVVFLFNYHIELVQYCVLVSLVADFFDGFVARFTKSSSAVGKELDSLADVVSFGMVPGAIIFQLLFQNFNSSEILYSDVQVYLYSSPAFIITLAAALRLAKFNLDTRQNESFYGLATPAATIFVVGLLLIILNQPFGWLTSIVYSKITLYATVLSLAAIMLIDIPMFGFKFKSFGWKGNEIRYVFIILSLLLIVTFKFAAVSSTIILYIIFSIAQKFFKL